MAKNNDGAEKAIRDIRRATRRRYSAEEKIRILLEGLLGEDSIVEPCCKEGINQNLYYSWSKEFLEAGKKSLAGDTAREATSLTRTWQVCATDSIVPSGIFSVTTPMYSFAWRRTPMLGCAMLQSV